MNIGILNRKKSPAGRLPRQLLALMVVVYSMFGASHSHGQDHTLSEYQVKAMFLVKFAKYVDWPPNTFATDTTPITVAVLAKEKLVNDLRSNIENKTVNGRSFVLKQITADGDLSGCHILFISNAENRHASELLGKAAALHVLSVGEDKQFTQNGGIINFFLKDQNVRLEINVAAATQAGLSISSRLLTVADKITGKAN